MEEVRQVGGRRKVVEGFVGDHEDFEADVLRNWEPVEVM